MPRTRERRRKKNNSFNSSTSGTLNNSRSRTGSKSHKRKKRSFKRSLKLKKKNGWRFSSSDLLKHLAESDRQESKNNQESTLEGQDSTIVVQDCTVISKKPTQEDIKILIRKLLGDKSSDLVHCFDDEANLLQDMDLVILGSTPEDYKRYTQLLRQEYAHMDDVTYKQMRLKVLQTLLMIPNIFSTTEFQSKYEQLARTNIKQEIEELKQ